MNFDDEALENEGNTGNGIGGIGGIGQSSNENINPPPTSGPSNPNGVSVGVGGTSPKHHGQQSSNIETDELLNFFQGLRATEK